MVVYEFKLYGAQRQFDGLAEAIRTSQFIRNKCLRVWIDNYRLPVEDRKTFGPLSFSYLCKDFAAEFEFANRLNAHARQAASERTYKAVAGFFSRLKARNAGKLGSRKVGYPRFQRDCRSVEYKTSGWKLSSDFRKVCFTDGHKIGWMALAGGRYITKELQDKIKRLRVVRRADGYYAQFCIAVEDQEYCTPTGKSVGLDMGVAHCVTDSTGQHYDLPAGLTRQQAKLKRYQRRVSRQKKGSKNRSKTRRKLSRTHLKITRQRQDFASKLARDVTRSNDLIVVEDLQVKSMTRSAKGTVGSPGKQVRQKAGLNRSILNANWGRIRVCLERYAKKFGRTVLAVAPQYTSQRCSRCGHVHAESRVSQDKFVCVHCGFACNADHNAAMNILWLGLNPSVKLKPAGHAGQACGAQVRPRVTSWHRAVKQEPTRTAQAVPGIPCL